MGIPLKTVSLEEMLETLDSRIRAFEENHEISSEDMYRRYIKNPDEEVEELVEWMQIYLVRQSLSKQTPIAGTRGITTASSTTSTKRNILS